MQMWAVHSLYSYRYIHYKGYDGYAGVGGTYID